MLKSKMRIVYFEYIVSSAWNSANGPFKQRSWMTLWSNFSYHAKELKTVVTHITDEVGLVLFFIFWRVHFIGNHQATMEIFRRAVLCGLNDRSWNNILNSLVTTPALHFFEFSCTLADIKWKNNLWMTKKVSHERNVQDKCIFSIFIRWHRYYTLTLWYNVENREQTFNEHHSYKYILMIQGSVWYVNNSMAE